MKKTVTTLLVVATVFLCFPFDAFAVTSGGKTIVSSSYSYNNGDVTLYTRVNGHDADETYTGGDRIYSYQHVFTVTLTNNTNEFQVAGSNNFTVDLYSGYSDTFAATTTNTPSGSQMYRPSWGSEVTSYSDNMSVPRVLIYSSGDYAGHVLISFEDSELLVLNPNETREYNFTINFNMSYDGINQYPINGNAQYSYFTYNGTVSMYSRPSGFTSNTIEDFINNDSIPNSTIAYFQYLIEQGIEDQDLYQQIIDILAYTYSGSVDHLGTSLSTPYTINSSSKQLSLSPINFYANVYLFKPRLVNRDVEIPYQDDHVYSSNLYCFSEYITIRVLNNTADAYKLSTDYIAYYTNTTFPSYAGYVGMDYDIIAGDYVPYLVNNTNFYFTNDSNFQGGLLIPAYSRQFVFMRINYYFEASYFDTISSLTDFSTNTSLASQGFNGTYSVTKVNGSIFGSIQYELGLLIDLLTGNKDNNNDISDQVSDNQTQEDVIHAQEEQWYQDNETAINAVGLSNYQFSGDQTSGLSGVTSQFTSVWNALDGWTNVYIFVLTLSLATFILRHKAETKAAQKTLDEYRPYSIGHLVRRRRSYH